MYCIVYECRCTASPSSLFPHQKNQADKTAVAGLKDLQQELERVQEECKRLKEKLAKTEAELQNTVEE